MSFFDSTSNAHEPDDDDVPIELEPDFDDEDDQSVFRLKPRSSLHAENPANQETSMETRDPMPMPRGKATAEPLRWVLDAIHHPAMAAADWLARDIDPQKPTAAELLSDPAISLAKVRQAKTVFKTMRIVGEKSADRRVGARMYAAAIAAGLVRHGKRVSTQSDAALKRGFQGLLDDRKMPLPLRDLAGLALCVLDEQSRDQNNKTEHKKTA